MLVSHLSGASRNFMRSEFEVSQIISRFKASFYDKYHPCEQVRKVFSSLEQCRTSALGGHVDACPECGAIRISYNSCRNRHCPKCQGIERENWIQARKEDVLPVKYFHVVFTLPDALHPLALGNMAQMYSCLFEAAWKTLEAFSKNKAVQPGMIAILHTWGSNLHYHPHLHCIVPEGGIDANGLWKQISGAKQESPFLFSVRGMSRMFRAKFMATQGKRMKVPQRIRKEVFEKEWVVYSKAPFKGVDKVIEYLGRYSHRVAISNSRIKDITENSVTFDYKDYRQKGSHKLMTLTGEEFLHRFSQHVLPPGFVRIRHYGFLAACNREKLRNIQRQMKIPCSPLKREKKKWMQVCQDKWIEYNLCKHCGRAQMITVETFRPVRPPPVLMKKEHEASMF